MKETINIEKKNEMLSLVTGISYSNVPSWYGASRRDLKMDVIMPKNIQHHKPCPCIIWVCGGSYMVENRAVWLPQFVPLARAGFIIASIDYRTSNESPLPAPIIDIKAAVRYLKAHAKEYCIDPDRIFLMGESAGGSLCSLAAVTSGIPEYDVGDYTYVDSSVSGAIIFYGICDYIKHMNSPIEKVDTVPHWTLEAFLGEGYTMEQAIKAGAAAYVSENSPPFMLLHGTEDRIIFPDQSQLLHDLLLEKGVKTQYLLLEGAHHCDARFYQPEMMERIAAFLNSI